MATLDDKLMGEKLHYYCSSSEDEEEEDENDLEDTASDRLAKQSSTVAPPPPTPWTGSSTNTGPKGVVQDFLAFQEWEKERLQQDDVEKIMLAKRLTLACRTKADDEAEKERIEKDEELLAEIMEDDDRFMKEYMEARIKQMTETKKRCLFGEVVDLESSEEFLKAIDGERADVSVVILLYERGAVGCDSMMSAFRILSSEYASTKFCCIRASAAGLSHAFKTKGVPAIIVYKAGQVIATYVKLVDEFGKEIHPGDVENFLIENGILHDRSLVLSC